ncbi:ArsR/SmtB family transcription factor [Desulfobaculum bizertense]|uniref:Transcriptional regulator, ArsR family n=1 Tax=Desulfobaculum bizertense DSM 18034 TaxID=1121442 RepID=A0A1T4WLZ4_9BACT|nr:metalloregulator ArsR/SmtB family transcription factor [Desulfobaculum bizertense]UIJ37089.1 metalloregulator ArsR/SmtB family transcription factor [Desulfobaculum bizertense]SKA77898.1 transcriptional regulator, ArsR family [Desulfobaculum bizertense DSM 18034]
MSKDECEVFCVHDDVVAHVAKKMPEAETFEGLANLFKALGDPTRARILYALSVQELCVCDIANILEMSSSAVSHQLRLLRHAKLIKNRRAGKSVFYTLDDNHVRHLFDQGLSHVMEERNSTTRRNDSEWLF